MQWLMKTPTLNLPSNFNAENRLCDWSNSNWICSQPIRCLQTDATLVILTVWLPEHYVAFEETKQAPQSSNSSFLLSVKFSCILWFMNICAFSCWQVKQCDSLPMMGLVLIIRSNYKSKDRNAFLCQLSSCFPPPNWRGSWPCSWSSCWSPPGTPSINYLAWVIARSAP